MKTTFFYAVIMATVFAGFLYCTNIELRKAKERRTIERRYEANKKLVLDETGNWVYPKR